MFGADPAPAGQALIKAKSLKSGYAWHNGGTRSQASLVDPVDRV